MAADQSASTHYRYMETVQGIPVLGLKEHVVLPLGAFPKTGLRAGQNGASTLSGGRCKTTTARRCFWRKKTPPPIQAQTTFTMSASSPSSPSRWRSTGDLAHTDSRAVVTRLDDSGDILTADVRVVQTDRYPRLVRRNKNCSRRSNTLKANRELSSDDSPRDARFAEHRLLLGFNLRSYQHAARPGRASRANGSRLCKMTMELLDHGSNEETLRELLVQLSLLQKTLLQLQKTLQDSHMLVQLSQLQKILFLLQKTLQDSLPTLKP